MDIVASKTNIGTGIYKDYHAINSFLANVKNFPYIKKHIEERAKADI